MSNDFSLQARTDPASKSSQAGNAEANTKTAHNPEHFANSLEGRLNWNSKDLYKWALAQAEKCIENKAIVSDTVFKITPTGETEESGLARAYDVKFWLLEGKKAHRRALSDHAQHLKAVGGKTGAKYVAGTVFELHVEDKAKQAEWIRTSVIQDKNTREETVSLGKVIGTPWKRFSKIYAFIKGIMAIANEDNGGGWMMSTITLPPQFHANPSVGRNSWSGKTVKEGWAVLAEGVNRMGAELAKQGIRKIGIGIEEPQKDETPHVHEGILYEDDKAKWAYFEAYARQFPGSLKIIEWVNKNEEKVTIYNNLQDVIERKGKTFEGGKGLSKKHSGRTTITIGSPDKAGGAASFASYLFKYIAKSCGVEAEDNSEEETYEEAHGLPKKAVGSTTEMVRAHRAAQGIRGMRLYGLPTGAISGWDELRRLNLEEQTVAKELIPLVKLAQTNDVAGYLRALGGLNPEAKAAESTGLRLWTTEATNKYGEETKKTIGIKLCRFTREKVKVATGKLKKNGEAVMKVKTETTETVIASAITRIKEWELLSETEAKGLALHTQSTKIVVGVMHNNPRRATTETGQQDAVNTPVGESVCVNAAAGSGKTHTLALRIKFLIEAGVARKDILATTFTKKAAQELKDRLKTHGIQGVKVGTLHAHSFGMLNGREQNFDKMITEATLLGEKSYHLLVDEAQDLTPAQAVWVKAHSKSIFAVGDSGQAIYGFSGADGKAMAHLLDDYKKRKVNRDLFNEHAFEISMEHNRRSTEEIVGLGNAINGGTAWASRSGAGISIARATSRQEELETIIKEAKGALILTRTNRERVEILGALAKAGVKALDVMTIHASKGCEADKVVLACGLLKAKTSGEAEERRLQYVASTRAKNKLIITATGALPEVLEQAVNSLTPRAN